ncbi:tRNA (adenosine(37)-N6)-dimethylallyltransferase MiaA [bacterium]|nr:tRNA (adenosine(37)-N6)-dimethylallyltransferase MiaA [bacterium]
MSEPVPVLIIAGPTSAGKSRLAMKMAQKWDTGIISADSRQIYRYMDIGTGKPTMEDQAIVSHHMIGIIDPDKSYSAGEYGREAGAIIERILKQGRIPIIAGGTGLYIRAATSGLTPSPPCDPIIKAGLLKQVEEKGINALHNELLKIDPPSAQRLHPNDRQRILRAMEVFIATGRRLSEYHKNGQNGFKYHTVFLFINRPRQTLYNMIEERVDKMFKEGLIQETESLIQKGYTTNHPGMQSLGYVHICEYLQGKIPLAEAKRLMKRDTRRYAKRQITWFKREKGAILIECPENGDILDLIPRIDGLVKR